MIIAIMRTRDAEDAIVGFLKSYDIDRVAVVSFGMYFLDRPDWFRFLLSCGFVPCPCHDPHHRFREEFP